MSDKINIELNITDSGDEQGSNRGPESQKPATSRGLFYTSVAASLGLRVFSNPNIEKSPSSDADSKVEDKKELASNLDKYKPSSEWRVKQRFRKLKRIAAISSQHSGTKPMLQAGQYRGSKPMQTNSLMGVFSTTEAFVREHSIKGAVDMSEGLAGDIAGGARGLSNAVGSGSKKLLGGISGFMNKVRSDPGLYSGDPTRPWSLIPIRSLPSGPISTAAKILKRPEKSLLGMGLKHATGAYVAAEMSSLALPLLAGFMGSLGGGGPMDPTAHMLRVIGDTIGEALSFITSQLNAVSDSVSMTVARTKLGVDADAFTDYSISQQLNQQKQSATRRINGDISEQVIKDLMKQIKG